MSDETDAVRAEMESQEDVEKAEEETTPDELAAFVGGGARWKHILEVRERLANPE